MATLDELVRSRVEEWLTALPVYATATGAPGDHDQLGDFSAAAFEHRERRAREWLTVFTNHPAADLSIDERVDRELVISHLRGQVLDAAWPSWRRDPGHYLTFCLYGVALLFSRRPAPEATLADAARSRLRQIPDVLAAARHNLDPDLAAPLAVRRARRVAVGGVSFVRDVLPAAVGDPAARNQVGMAAEDAVAALADFVDWLDRFAERAHGDWAMGGERYSAVLRERECLTTDVAGLHELGRRAYDELDATMREVSQRIAGGGPDWVTVMEALNADHPPNPRALREEYAAATARARRFVVDHDLVSLPDGEICEVAHAPVFARGTNSGASYLPPPALSGRRIGRFHIPHPPDGATPEEVVQLLRDNARSSIPTITAHETYPGHHWHHSWLSTGTRLARKTTSSDFFEEGWALYAEHLMREHGFFTDHRQELAHLRWRIIRAARVVLDTGLHTGDLTAAAAIDFLIDRLAFTPVVARAEVERYCANPVQASAYLTGALEIERIRERWRAANPGAPLRRFHDTIAGAGLLPLGLAELVVLGAAPADR